ncbi:MULTISPECIES: hypothetical protein [unclassified Agarivorans]|uniref:hypothetical protein n=1 Tax=unclassified Agarivorans TaxID=2636026 RepID=UPI0026E1F66D|nr:MULTISPECIES: hypothetical protein [unclassified Agarivorans]MDO6686729.1 hypothetical protein [Agarivorans sp. 3_MG-2023]MDO6716541.1 hypothetical protein [Agarivorans sp. 2_MG-2023]
MKFFVFVFCVLLSVRTLASELIISSDIKITYPEPELISHSSDTLILKYPNWTFSHSAINPETMYAAIDLTGIELDFIQSIFVSELRNKQPDWLSTLATEQAESLGLSSNKAIEKALGTATIYAVYNSDETTGYVFLVEDTQAHQITIIGSKKHYLNVIQWLKLR